MQTFKIYTLGCKVNQYDSQAIREQLVSAGLKELTDGKKAQYYIINTCTVTNNADRESRYLIRLAKRESPLAKIVVTGCYAHSNAKEIGEIEGIDLILNNDDKHRIVEFLLPNSQPRILPPFEISDFEGHTRAFVKIQDGCDNFCSFCKVPYVRGRSRSRKVNSVISEIKRLSDKGYKEIVLSGICLGDYGKDFNRRIDLVDLIEEIEKMNEILRIRLSSIEAKDVTDRLIEKLKTSKKLCPHLHIPFQSGDNEILKLMNRRDFKESYLELVHKLKKEIKDMAITTDIMIGFPNEEDENFLNTVNFLKRIEPARVHIFTFQPRDGTPLSNFRNTIPRYILTQRYILLKKVCDELILRFMMRFLNHKLNVLFEDKKDGFWKGYSGNYLSSGLKISDNLNLTNRLIKVKVKKISSPILFVELERE